MGEYALYHDREIKIGTCEDMYYARLDQRHWLTPVENSLNFEDEDILREMRWRFPFPDEDMLRPGGFDHYNRRATLPYLAVPEGVTHYRQGCSGAGAAVVQQRWQPWGAMLILACDGCGAKYRVPTVEDVIPFLESCQYFANVLKDGGDEKEALFWLEVAKRVAKEYKHAPRIHQELTGQVSAAPKAKPVLTLVPTPPPEPEPVVEADDRTLDTWLNDLKEKPKKGRK